MSARDCSDDSAARADRRTGAVLKRAVAALAHVSDTPRLDAEVLLAHATGRSRGSLLAFPERALDSLAAERFAALLLRRAAGEPVAYLLGTREFFSLPVGVSPDVLIPRPETELLVQETLLAIDGVEQPSVLDVGTGSGAIAVAVKRTRADAQVTGSDASAAALAVARANAARLALDVRFVESAWFEALGAQTFDAIVSNPPYVRSADVRGALAFEPRLALDGGPDGFHAYRALLPAAARHLVAGSGVLLLEHGSEQRAELVQLAIASGWRVVAAHDDLAGRARVLVLARAEGAA
jgi:release factor glutamine methyltransferase